MQTKTQERPQGSEKDAERMTAPEWILDQIKHLSPEDRKKVKVRFGPLPPKNR